MARYGIKRHLKTVFDIPRWAGYQSAKDTATMIKGLARDAVGRGHRQAGPQDASFEDAMARLGVDEEHIQKRKRQFLWMACCYFLIAMGLFVYAIHLARGQHWDSAAIALALSWVIGAFGFREHFWFTQIKLRRLGLSVSDWARETFVFGDDAS